MAISHKPKPIQHKTIAESRNLINEKTRDLMDYKIYDQLKKGSKLSTLLDLSSYNNELENLEILLQLSNKIKEMIEKLALAGIINNNISKIYLDIIAKIEKSFRSKRETLELSSEINKKRLVTLIKFLVHLLNTARFFKDDGSFLEGKWWKSKKDEVFLQGLSRRIINKCDAIVENYENVYFYFHYFF